MDVVVLVPRRPDPWRDRLWGYVRGHLDGGVSWPVLEGLDADGPFNRSAAVNAAAASQPWDVAVVLDADTVVDPDHLRRGAELAITTGKLVLPHDQFRSLSKPATEDVLAGHVDPAAAPERWTTPNTKSSCLCIGRALWEEVGGFDEAFLGWGFEDAAFYAACRELGGVERLPGPVHHLWHPRSAEKDTESPNYIANQERAQRYKIARGEGEMRALLAELRG